MDNYKDLRRKDLKTDDEYLFARVKCGPKAGYTFDECYNHWVSKVIKRGRLTRLCRHLTYNEDL